MIRLTFKELLARKRRLLGSFLAVFLGVAFMAGTLVLGDTMESGIKGLLGQAYAGTDVAVRNATSVSDQPGAQRGFIDASLLARVRAVDGVAVAEPVIRGTAQLMRTDGKAVDVQGPRTGGNWITDPSLNPYRIAQGRAPAAPGEVVIDRKVAKDGDLKVGDRTFVLTPERVPVTIVGIATFGSEDALGGSSFTAFTLGDASRHIAHDPDRISSVAVKATSGLSETALATRIKAVLPPGVEAITGSALTEENVATVGQFVTILRTFLGVFAGVALLVAVLSIHNTFSIIVAQRSREAALLRAIGASRRQILGSVVIEALIIGLTAALAGALAGFGFAALLKALFGALGFGLSTIHMEYGSGPVLLAVPVGVIVTLVASLTPAYRASKVPPLAALRETAVESTEASRARTVIGAVLAAAGGALLIWAVSDSSQSTAGAGSALVVASMVVLGPLVARPAARLLGSPAARWRGASGVLARENAMRSPRRMAGAATALMIGVGVVTLFTVVAASLSATVERQTVGLFDGDLVVDAGSFGRGGFSPQLGQEIAALPQVASSVAIGNGQVKVDGAVKSVNVADPVQLGRVLRLKVKAGALGSGLAVATSAGKPVGSSVQVLFADGSAETFTVEAVYEKPTDDFAAYMIPRSSWVKHYPQSQDARVYLKLRPDTSEGKKAVTQVAAQFGSPAVQTRSEFVDAQTQQVRSLLSVIYVMLAFAIMIALMGIANTLSLAVHERLRELGLLRAVGATRAQIRSMVRWESVTVSLFGTAGGAGLGMFLAWVLSAAGDTSYAIPAAQMIVIILVGGLAGALSAIRPARRAARLRIISALGAP